MKAIMEESIDMIYADPPYFLSNGGKTIKSGKITLVNKGEWDRKENYCDINIFTEEWLSECYRILKKNGTIWISGTKHNLFCVENILQKLKFKIINIIIWEKTDPPDLIYKNKFKFSYEFIIWAKKGNNYIFNYTKMFNVNNKEHSDVWKLPAVNMSEKTFGYHPTQKPEILLMRIVLACTKEGNLILDPFMGSGTTCVVAKKLGRRFIGIEKEEKYYNIALNRLNGIN